jgi:hypothetical protein
MKAGRIISVKTSTERESGGENSYYVTVSIETGYQQYEDLRLEVESSAEQAKTFNYWGLIYELSQNMQEKRLI